MSDIWYSNLKCCWSILTCPCARVGCFLLSLLWSVRYGIPACFVPRWDNWSWRAHGNCGYQSEPWLITNRAVSTKSWEDPILLEQGGRGFSLFFFSHGKKGSVWGIASRGRNLFCWIRFLLASPVCCRCLPKEVQWRLIWLLAVASLFSFHCWFLTCADSPRPESSCWWLSETWYSAAWGYPSSFYICTSLVCTQGEEDGFKTPFSRRACFQSSLFSWSSSI